MKETSKCQGQRERRGDFDRYLRGEGLDIGPGDDPLRVPRGKVGLWTEDCGDAVHLHGLGDGVFDFVYSSHCLEHLRDIEYGLANWIRVLKPGGCLYVVVPDFELYEKRQWPSRFNSDHRATFSMNVTRSEAGGRPTHFHCSMDLVPLLKKYGVNVLEMRVEDYGYDYGAAAEMDQTLGPASAQLCLIGRKTGRRGITVFLRNELGAGDHANLLPGFRYLHNIGYDVVGHRAYSLYDNLPVRDPGQAADIEIPAHFIPEKNLPCQQLTEEVRSRLGVDLSGVVFPGICFSQREWEQVRRDRAQRRVNVFPYTSIRQKVVHPEIVRAVVRHIENKGFAVFTSKIGGSEGYPWTDLFRNFHPPRPGHFSRAWVLDVAGGILNVCCDGGPLNVSLAAGVPTVGLMTIANRALMQFYPAWQWRAVQSSFPCSPCFRAADYGARVVAGCPHPDDFCGNHFSVDSILSAIDDLL